MSAETNALKLKRTLLSPERSEVGQSASAHKLPVNWESCTHVCAAHTPLNLAIENGTQEMAVDEG